MTEHSITPPPALVRQWLGAHFGTTVTGEVSDVELALATQAARWGADQELLACGKYLEQCAAWEEEDVTEMYNYRRPKPPSLKEQALEELNKWREVIGVPQLDTIRRALEQLDD